MKTYIRKRTKLALAILPAMLIALTAATGLVLTDKPQQSSALSGSDFNPGRIIDDEIFFDSRSMSVSQIQQFLNARVPNCDTNGDRMHRSGMTRRDWAAQSSDRDNPPYTCLKDYTEQIPSVSNSGSDLCTGSISGGNKTAAQIIHDVSRACGINPQVLIVKLQKEQSLVTDDWPWEIQYNRAMGYACPDSGPNNSANCNSAFYGFFNQVYNAAQAFKRYEANPTRYNYRANRNNSILYHPNTSCGSSTVFIENQATANLYIYTPYQPNRAALDNLYGTGNSCSSYGNRNFWRLFNDWFGSTLAQQITFVPYKITTDTGGDRARIGVRLSHRPTHNVRIPFGVSSTSNAKVVGSSSILITPQTWNDPSQNIITIEGLNNPDLRGTMEYEVRFSRPLSADSRYSRISASLIEPIRLLQQDTRRPTNVYRLYNETTRQHYFTASPGERNSMIGAGWRDEGTRFNYCHSGNVPLYRLVNGNNTRLVRKSNTSGLQSLLNTGFSHDRLAFSMSSQGTIPVYERFNASTGNTLYTTAAGEAANSPGWEDKGIAFYACQGDHRPVYRLFRPSTGSHFFTVSRTERNRAQDRHSFRYEGTGFYTCRNSPSQEVHRLYRPSTGNHFFTSSTSERDRAVRDLGFRAEGVGFRMCANSERSVHRLYNPITRNHFLTTSTAERNNAVNRHGFRVEGIFFNSL